MSMRFKGYIQLSFILLMLYSVLWLSLCVHVLTYVCVYVCDLKPSLPLSLIDRFNVWWWLITS